MIKCCEDCPEACDFCKHYDYNGEDGVYTGDGWCNKHQQNRDPGEYCEDYHCRRAVTCKDVLEKAIKELDKEIEKVIAK